MKSGRLEAFSDGVLAIVITIMVLEMKAPEDTTLEALVSISPVFLSYLLSFLYVAIYWNNHHHLFQATEKVNGKILWANLHLLFWLSLIPFTTSWVGEHYYSEVPIALYGLVLFMSSIAYRILQISLLKQHSDNTMLLLVTKGGIKENISMLLYALAIGLSFYSVWISSLIYLGLAIIWIIPNKKLEKEVTH